MGKQKKRLTKKDIEELDKYVDDLLLGLGVYIAGAGYPQQKLAFLEKAAQSRELYNALLKRNQNPSFRKKTEHELALQAIKETMNET